MRLSTLPIGWPKASSAGHPVRAAATGLRKVTRASLSVAITASPMLPRVAVHRSSLCKSLVPSFSTLIAREQGQKDSHAQAQAQEAGHHHGPAQVRGLNALDAQPCFHILKLQDLPSKDIHSEFSLLVLIESGVGFSRAAKGDNPAGVPFPLHIAGMKLLQPLLLLREIAGHHSYKAWYSVSSLFVPSR